MGISWQQLLIVLIIVALIFGTKRLRNIGSDLGSAVKGFKDSMNDAKDSKADESGTQDQHKQETAASDKKENNQN